MFKVIINFFAVIIIILIFNNSLYSQSLELLKEIDISKEVVKKENWKHLQIFSSDKQRIGNYFAINLNKLIVSNIDKLKISDYLSVIILLETIDGSCLVTTIEDFKIINNKIIPYLLIKEANRQPFIPKTLKDTEIEGDVNLNEVIKPLTLQIHERLLCCIRVPAVFHQAL